MKMSRKVLMLLTIVSSYGGSLQTDCCEKIHVDSTGGTRENRGYVLGTYKKESGDQVSKHVVYKHETMEYYLVYNSKAGWRISRKKDRNGSPLINFKKCKEECPQHCENNEKWEYFHTTEDEQKDSSLKFHCEEEITNNKLPSGTSTERENDEWITLVAGGAGGSIFVLILAILFLKWKKTARDGNVKDIDSPKDVDDLNYDMVNQTTKSNTEFTTRGVNVGQTGPDVITANVETIQCTENPYYDQY